MQRWLDKLSAWNCYYLRGHENIIKNCDSCFLTSLNICRVTNFRTAWFSYLSRSRKHLPALLDVKNALYGFTWLN